MVVVHNSVSFEPLWPLVGKDLYFSKPEVQPDICSSYIYLRKISRTISLSYSTQCLCAYSDPSSLRSRYETFLLIVLVHTVSSFQARSSVYRADIKLHFLWFTLHFSSRPPHSRTEDKMSVNDMAIYMCCGEKHVHRKNVFLLHNVLWIIFISRQQWLLAS